MTRPPRVPDLLVEKLHLGELTPSEADTVRARLAATEPDAGAARLAALAALAANDANDATLLAQRAPRPRLVTPRRFHPAWLAIPIALALALLIALPSDPTELRPKGNTLLLIQRQTPSGSTLVTASDRLAAGDTVQLQVRSASPRFLAVLSIDGRGALTTHLAPTPTALTTLDLPKAFVLDDAPGFERFALFASPTPLDLAALEAALHELATSPDPAHLPIRIAPPIEVTDVLVGKALPP